MSAYIVLDTETTGLGEHDQVIEMAWVASTGDGFHQRWRPTVPIDPAASAAHHLTAPMLRTYDTAIDHPPILPPVPIFAHNAEFDYRMIAQTWPTLRLQPFICTWRLARHLWPEAPGHSNQVLRYWLGLGSPHPWLVDPPHSATHDSAVTALLVERMLRLHPLAHLIELAPRPILLAVVNFGRHRGARWADVPRDYLRWLLTQDFDPDTRHTALTVLNESRGAP